MSFKGLNFIARWFKPLEPASYSYLRGFFRFCVGCCTFLGCIWFTCHHIRFYRWWSSRICNQFYFLWFWLESFVNFLYFTWTMLVIVIIIIILKKTWNKPRETEFHPLPGHQSIALPPVIDWMVRWGAHTRAALTIGPVVGVK